MSQSVTLIQPRALRFDQEVYGRPQPWTVVTRGLEYPGDVVVAESVNADWSKSLRTGLCFRLVFYTVPRRVQRAHILDPRIAIAVPRRSADPTRESLAREISAIRESRERYVTEPDTEAQGLRRSMVEREAAVLSELVKRDALSYAQGRVYTQAGLSARPAEAFVGRGVDEWADRLATHVLEEACPELPFRFAEFPRTLTSEDAEAVFRGILRHDAQAAAVAGEFGPALELSAPESPLVFEPAGSRALAIIRREVDAHDGEIRADGLIESLVHGHGLNPVLAALYLLAFVLHAHGEIELRPDHSLRDVRGQPFPGDLVSWDLVQEVAFTETLVYDARTLRVRQPAVWNSVVPYASLIVADVTPSREEKSIDDQEQLLIQALGDLGGRVEHSKEGLGELAAALLRGASGAVATLDKLKTLSEAGSYQGFREAAQSGFGGPSGLTEALDVLDRVSQLAELVPLITRLRIYLDAMTFGATDRELSVERDALSGRLGMDSLLGDPKLWPSVEDSFKQLRRRYAAVYVEQHSTYHRDAAELLYSLQALEPRVDSLARLNGVREFGGPLGVDLPEQFAEIVRSLRTCDLQAHQISIEEAPHCEECHLPLNEAVPAREASRLGTELETAVREYNRRLGSEGVKRVLAHSSKENLEKFINVIQIGDIASLANVLDDDDVGFLRDFVRAD